LLPIVLMIGLLAATPVPAQDTAVAADPTALTENTVLPSEWRFSLRPYFFLAGLSGSVTVETITFPINSSFSTLLNNVEMGGFISFSAEKDRWGINADFQYINLYGKGSGSQDHSMDLKNIIGEVSAMFRPAGAPTLRFLAGLRAYSVGQTVTLFGAELPEISTTLVDPIVGAYGSWMLHDRWDFELRGDIGGFGISSEFTYQLMALFRWGINDSLSLPLGYRVLGYQIQKDGVLMNTRMSGMMLGLDIRF